MTTRPPRAGPNPDGEARQAGSQARPSASKSPKVAGRRIADAARFRPLCGEPLRRGETGVRPRHHRSRGRSRVPGLRNPAPASRPVREVCDRARHRRGGQGNPRADRAAASPRENPPPISSTRSTCAACRSMSTSAPSCRAPSSANCWIRISAARTTKAASLIDDPAAVESVLDLCTGSGCLAILASRHFPNAADRRGGYFEGRARGRRAQRRRSRPGRPRHAAPRRPVRAARRQALRPDHLQSALCRRAGHGRRCRANAAPSRNSPSTAAPTGSTSSAASWTRPAASDAAGRAVVRNRPRPREAGGRLSAIAAALARHRGFRRRSVLDRAPPISERSRAAA